MSGQPASQEPKTYYVGENDHIALLAAAAGYGDWKALWEDNSELSSKRSNPFILFHGDENKAVTGADGKPGSRGDMITITTPVKKEESGAADQHHQFRVERSGLRLKIRILNDEFQPLANAKYSLQIDGKGIVPPRGAPAVLDADGFLDVELPKKTSRRGILRVELPKYESAEADEAEDAPPVTVTFNLQIGRLDPIGVDSAPDAYCISGVQQRLNNLGFGAGKVDGVNGDVTQAAARSFGNKFIGGPEYDDRDRPFVGVVGQEKLEAIHDLGEAVPPPEES